MNNHKKKLVSVIIAAYNVEDLIDRAINSVRKQTYEKLEIIIVNDGSEDNTLNICSEHELLDKRISVISIDNGGLGNARNTGVATCVGDYVLFLDGDDYYSKKDLIERLVDDAETTGSDWVVFNYELKDAKGNVKCRKSNDSLDNMYTAVWNKMYSKELVTSVKHPTGVYFEDIVFSLEMYLRAKKRISVDVTGYSYWQRTDSIIRDKNYLRHIDALDIMNAFLDDRENHYLTTEVRAYLGKQLINHFFVSLHKFKFSDEETIDKELVTKFDLAFNRINWCFSKKWYISSIFVVLIKWIMFSVKYGWPSPLLGLVNIIRVKTRRLG